MNIINTQNFTAKNAGCKRNQVSSSFGAAVNIRDSAKRAFARNGIDNFQVLASEIHKTTEKEGIPGIMHMFCPGNKGLIGICFENKGQKFAIMGGYNPSNTVCSIRAEELKPLPNEKTPFRTAVKNVVKRFAFLLKTHDLYETADNPFIAPAEKMERAITADHRRARFVLHENSQPSPKNISEEPHSQICCDKPSVKLKLVEK
jgi:hypothetical protein